MWTKFIQLPRPNINHKNYFQTKNWKETKKYKRCDDQFFLPCKVMWILTCKPTTNEYNFNRCTWWKVSLQKVQQKYSGGQLNHQRVQQNYSWGQQTRWHFSNTTLGVNKQYAISAILLCGLTKPWESTNVLHLSTTP